MDKPRTCGQGLAETATLPAKLAELTAAMAGILETHRAALDLSDEKARREDEAYADLASQYRTVAAELGAISDRMVGYRGLPMGRHDPQVMHSPGAADAFRRFVEVEEELRMLLEERLTPDRRMLGEMDEDAMA